jgi:uncharacterized protein YjiK
MHRSFLSYFCLSLIFFILSCTGQTTQDAGKQQTSAVQLSSLPNPFPYQLGNPDTIFILPPELYEVSALSFHREGELAMVEDEHGILYLFDWVKGEMSNKIMFGKDDDYEGVEQVGEIMYALKSDGDLFKIQYYDSDSIQTTKFETSLSKDNDTEGLGFDVLNNQLLIACKATPYLSEKNYKGSKAIYAFDLALDSLLADPVTLIGKSNLKNYFEAQLPEGQKWPEEKVTFNPSAIAIHPLNGEIYILASTGKLLVAVNRKGEILKAFHLDSQLFKHPEGMCFLPDGTLFISNEGDAGRPNLLKFSIQ